MLGATLDANTQQSAQEQLQQVRKAKKSEFTVCSENKHMGIVQNTEGRFALKFSLFDARCTQPCFRP